MVPNPDQPYIMAIDEEEWEQNFERKLTVTIVLLLCSINSSICLQLQVETLSTVQLRHNPLQLGFCGKKEETGMKLQTVGKT